MPSVLAAIEFGQDSHTVSVFVSYYKYAKILSAQRVSTGVRVGECSALPKREPEGSPTTGL